MKILILNCGSSSVKYKLFQMPGEEILSEGIIERIGFSNSRLKFIDHACNEIVTEKRIHDHDEAIRIILNALTDKKYGYLKDLSDLDAVGHRVAHGGDSFRDSTLINNLIFTKIQEYSDNLKGIEAIRKQLPGIKQVAVFDTAFHHTLPEYAYTYAIPYELSDKYKIRRYGFHGTSHSYVSRRACEILNRDITKQRIITCHLGNGSSIAAIAGGKSIDTSMGFTPMEGLIMGTRPGDLDVGILPFIMKNTE
jgi:acetate kinase